MLWPGFTINKKYFKFGHLFVKQVLRQSMSDEHFNREISRREQGTILKQPNNIKGGDASGK